MSSQERRFHRRVHALADRATEDCAGFEPPAEPPDESQAMELLREGVGPAVSLYVEAKTGGLNVHLPPAEYRALEESINDWLALYGACYGVDIEPNVTVRVAAELLIDTHNIKDVAQILTGIPERNASDTG
ncbi:hypothetical protein ACFQJ7_05510 [Halovenus rubra]|uniref:Uncharacterized protein n=2 Tax=Halovenus rubra TaxID=869890 RepID=A0ACC7DXK2_9EURY|nr:hypothetical protein [Halovenus rubra]